MHIARLFNVDRNTARLRLFAFITLLLTGCGNSGVKTNVTPAVPFVPTEILGGTIQGKPLNLTAVVSTLVKGSKGNVEGSNATVMLNRPRGITTNDTFLYVTDAQHRILKILISTGAVTTLAGGGKAGYVDETGKVALFNYPGDITSDGNNLYVADTSNHKIRKIVIASGRVMTLAGGATEGYADGIGTSALFNNPVGITTDGVNLYVTEVGNNKIRKIVLASGRVTTLAGGSKAGYADGKGSAALFNQPQGITIDGTYLYVADFGNNRIRKILISTGEVTTLAGGATAGHADGSGTSALFNGPVGITTDGNNLYVADTSNHKIRHIVIASRLVTTLAGGTGGGYADGTDAVALFYEPVGITSDGRYLYITDRQNHSIRKIQ